MASGFIYLIILGMWGAYFLPRWIREHEVGSMRAGDRYTTALRSITESSPFAPEFDDPMKRMKQVSQRRMFFTGILFLFAASVFIAALGLMTWMMVAIPATALAIYIVAVRHQIKKAELKKHKIDTLERILTAEIKIDPRVRIDLPPVTLPQEILTQAKPEYWIPFSERSDNASARVQQVEEEVAPSIVAESAETWSPIAVPRPTYASAAKAITPARRVDLSQSAQWNAEQEILRQMDIEKNDPITAQLEDEATHIHPAVND